MRQAFVNTLEDIAAKDPRVLLLSGDLGFKVFDAYRARLPKQFLNTGVAESNMVGMAAGMSMQGKVPFIYSIVPFLVMRPFEQIRNDVCFHRANVKIVGVGGGFSYGPNGTSHHAMNDVALMRALPEMTILTPGDPQEARLAVLAAHAHQGPVYIRLGRGQDDSVHQGTIQFKLGQAIHMRQGTDVGIIVSGVMLKTAVAVADALKADGLSVHLISMPTVKPVDGQAIEGMMAKCSKVFTLEEHSRIGGMGSAVLEFCHAQGLDTRKLKCLAAPDQTIHETGTQEYLRDCAGLSVGKIIGSICSHINPSRL